MQDIRYHSVQPSNKKSTYSEFDNIDFILNANGRKLVGGSVRILGDVTVYPNGVNPLTETVSFDGLTGSHSWFNSIITSCSSIGQVENLNFYPHMVASKARAQLSREDTFQSQYACENRVPDGRMSCAVLKGTTAGVITTYDPTLIRPMDFAVRPDFCLNSFLAGTDNNLPFAKTGDITISLIVSQSISVLFGTEKTGTGAIGVDRNISISNLRITFTSVPDDGQYPKAYQMRVGSSLKQSLQSTYSNISTLAPLIADRFWMAFVPQSWDNSAINNGLACYRPPNVSRVEYLWSDSFNTEYTYAIVNEEEMLTNAIKAVNGIVSDNQATLNILASNDGYLLGMPFGSFIDLRQNKLSINLESAISSSNPITCYMFFSGVVSL
jgi:hypothetical protein